MSFIQSPRRRPKRTRPSAFLPLLVALMASGGCSGESDRVEPVTLEGRILMESGASNPTLALDPATGEALVTWIDGSTVEGNVWLRRVSANGAAPAVRVNDRPGDAAPHLQAPAQVAAGPAGDVAVLWQRHVPRPEEPFPGSDLRIAHSTDGGRSLAPATYVNDDAGEEPSSHTFHDLLLLEDGTPMAIWLDGRLPPDPGDEDGYDGPEVRVAHGSHASAGAGGHHGTGFGKNRILAHDSCPCCRTALTTDETGTVWAAWRTVLPGNIRDIMVARSEDRGRSWSEPVRVHADEWEFEGCPHAGPALTVDPRGAVHVIWYTGAEGRQGLWYAASEDGGRSFDVPSALLETGFAAPATASLAATAEGELWAAWEDRTPEGEKIVRVWNGRVGAERPAPGRAGWRVPGGSPDLVAGAGGAWLATLNEGAVRVVRIRDDGAPPVRSDAQADPEVGTPPRSTLQVDQPEETT